MKYVRKKLQEVEVTDRTENTDDKAGRVKFINEFGSECVMTTNQFDEMYEPFEE